MRRPIKVLAELSKLLEELSSPGTRIKFVSARRSYTSVDETFFFRNRITSLDVLQHPSFLGH